MLGESGLEMTIVLFCNNHEQYEFFCRCVLGIERLGKRTLFLSHRLSVVLRARRDGYPSRLLRGFKRLGDGSLAYDSEVAFEVRHNLLTPQEACRLVQRVEGFARNFFATERPEQIWFWDGCNLMRQVLARIGRSFDVKTLFFQLGNFPGKLFVDMSGVNIRSEYARRRHFFDASTKVDWVAYRDWKNAYLTKKTKRHVVKQKSSLVRFNWSYALDVIGFNLLGAPTNEKQRPVAKILNFLCNRWINYKLDGMEGVEDGSFLLFPLQVNAGSQVLWNSQIGQLDVIEKISGQAQKERCVLVVKTHPVEDDASFLKALIKLRDKLGFRLVNEDLFQLLLRCRCLVTLNSTAGLEAMLIGKSVKIFGQAHYAGFSEADLAFYVQRFLLDIDCFSKNDLSIEQVQAIFERSTPLFWNQFEKAESLCQ